MRALPIQLALPSLPRNAGVWLFSAAVHAFLLVHFVAPDYAPNVPVGHWVEMLPSAKVRTQAAPAPSPTETASDAPAVAKPAPSKAPTAPSLGNTSQSTGLTGRVGALDGVQASVRERYLYELEAFINQHKTYPPRARHLGLSGKVEVAFHLEGDGTIRDPHVVRPCIHDMLNVAAVDLVRRAGRFRPMPSEIAVPLMHVTVPIEYELR